MKTARFVRTVAAAMALTFAPPIVGCFVSSNDHVVDTGTVTMRWSVEGAFDPGSCVFFRAAQMEVVVYDAVGNVVAQVNPPCEAFGQTLTLLPGTYTASLTLLDANGRAVSTTLDTAPFDVFAGRGSLIDTDFPESSFF